MTLSPTTLRIIVGPTEMYVERGGMRSAPAHLDDKDGPAEVREKARALYDTIKRLVAFLVWYEHRMVMAAQRTIAARILVWHSGPWHRGPRPDLIATKPWVKAQHGDWVSVPHGAASLLVRGDA